MILCNLLATKIGDKMIMTIIFITGLMYEECVTGRNYMKLHESVVNISIINKVTKILQF